MPILNFGSPACDQECIGELTSCDTITAIYLCNIAPEANPRLQSVAVKLDKRVSKVLVQMERLLFTRGARQARAKRNTQTRSHVCA